MNNGGDVLFVLMGAVMVLAMHAGFAFLEVGTVRKKNQVNALVKIIADFAVSTLAYFFVGYGVAYGTSFFTGAHALADKNGYELVKFFFLLTFAAAIPAIISGGIAERARFYPQLAATALLVGLVYPFFEGITWNGNFGLQAWLEAHFGAKFHDFAGSVVVHAVGGWLGLMAVLFLGARHGRYTKAGRMTAHPPSSIPFLALGAWILTVGWIGFNVMSAQSVAAVNGLVALNSLMAMVGGVLAALVAGRCGPGGVRRLRPDASGGRAGDRRGGRGAVRLGLHPHPEQMEDRRRARCVAAARPVRRVGRHCRGHFRQRGAGRAWRGERVVTAHRYRTRRAGCARRRRCRLWRSEGRVRSAFEPGRGIRRRRSQHPQDRFRAALSISAASVPAWQTAAKNSRVCAL